MSRTFEPISVEDLCEKIRSTAAPFMDEHTDPGLRGQIMSLFDEGAFEKDLKVNVDFENFECEAGEGYNGCASITGPQTLDTGLAFVGCSAGGDWQVPVFFIIYWDGKRLRAYVPTDGNTWNTDTKTAYGDDARADFMNAKKRYPQLADQFDAEVARDTERRTQLGISSDYFEFDTSSIPECDPIKIAEDIRARIVEKSKTVGESAMPPVCDGFNVTRSGNFIILQPTLKGDVKGGGLMMTVEMATKVAFDLIKNAG